MDGSILPYVIAFILAICALLVFFKKSGKDAKKAWNVLGVFFVVVALFLIAMQYGLLSSVGINPLGKLGVAPVVLSAAGTQVPVIQTTIGKCPVQETGSYSSLDVFTAANVAGTAYYKEGNLKATTTAKTNLNKGTTYSYWMSNESNVVEPVTVSADCGVNTFQANAYNNGTDTLSAYDTINNKALVATGTGQNVTLGANANAKVEFTVIGSAKTAAAPLGGVLVIEANKSVTTIACSGDGILGLNNKYSVTYSAQDLTDRYVIYEIAKGFDLSEDNGNTGITRKFTCDFATGTDSASGSKFFATIIPANWYLGNDGNFHLDTEQGADADTTRTGLSEPTQNWYFD